jgi:hypothetical protein
MLFLGYSHEEDTLVVLQWQVPWFPARSRPCPGGVRGLVGPALGQLLGQSQAHPGAGRQPAFCGPPHCGHGAAQPAARPGALPHLLQVEEVLLLHLLCAGRIPRHGASPELYSEI